MHCRPKTHSVLCSASIFRGIALVAFGLATAEGATPQRPPPLSSHVMTYHAQLGQVVLFGGSKPDRSFSNTLWAWDGKEWTALSQDGPAPRIHAAMAYDVHRNRLVVHGGIKSREASYGDTWEWDGDSWQQVDTGDTGPGVRDHHAMAFDAQRGVCVLFGGQNSDDEFPADTWEWDGESWSLVATAGPPPRGTHRLAWDAATRTVVLVAGWGPNGQLDDMWEWNGERWTQRDDEHDSPGNVSRPSARGATRIAYDTAHKQLVLFGGYVERQANDETWVRDGARWAELRVAGPTARNVHGMAHDAGRQRVVLYGGIGAEGRGDDTWEWDGEAWHLVLAATSVEERVEALVREAMDHGYGDGDIAACVRKLREAEQLQPDNADVQVRLAKALLTLGDFDAGHATANHALELNPLAGGAHFARAQALLLSGDSAGAERVIRAALENEDMEMRRGDQGGLSLTLVSILMHAGQFEEAARFLEAQRPSLTQLHEQPMPESVDDIGGGWHAIGAYAHVLAELGHTERSKRLLRRFEPLNEAFIVARNGGEPTAIDLWNLTATGAGRIPTELALGYLERAFEGGFVLSWRYNFAQHPTLWPLRGERRFQELLRAMDTAMKAQLESLPR